MIETLAVVAALIVACGEFYIWHAEILWHGEPKRDPRNSPPPR
jgi:hypothetical protein